MASPPDDYPRWLAGPSARCTRFGEVPHFAAGLYQVGPRAYAWMVPNGSWGETNLGLVDGGHESLLVDTCWDLAYTREMLEAARPVLDRAPVEYVVNTHADGDHCWGNQLFAGKTILGTVACAAQMGHLQPRVLHALKAAGRLLRRLPLARVDAFGHYMAEMFAPYDFRDLTLTPPNRHFCGETVVRVGTVEVVIREVGPGHTDGDAIAHVPALGVAYAGDILFAGATPVLWAGPLDSVLSALDRLDDCRARVIVPGHGPLASAADVQAVRDYWHYVHEALHAHYVRDLTPFEAARAVALSADFRMRPFARWDSPERLVTNAVTLYRHWGAKLRMLPGKLGVMELMRQQATLALLLPDATPARMHRLPH